MSDEEHDGEEQAEDGGSEEDVAAEPPRPATWAGRSRAGAEEDADAELTRLEAELSADLDDVEPAAEPGDVEPAEPAAEPGDGEPDAADELEEPPSELEFEEDDEAGAGDEADADDAVAAEPAAEPEPEPEAPAPAGQETVEFETPAISDREAAQEAAHAGLRARAEKAAAGRVATTGAQAAVAQAVAAAPAAGAGEPPKRTVWWRFVAASFVIVASVAAATSVAFLLYLTDIGDRIDPDNRFSESVAPSLSEVEGGEPQTILIVGSDKRAGTGEVHGRSDTTMLLRVDPDKDFLALLSLPRDLGVEIPGYGPEQKLNAAYSYGGPQLTLKTVTELLGIDINHIVNVDFEGFYDAINAIGCVYIDVDRHYFNPVGGEYDDIDIQPGYTKLCGYRALDYVRYRHNDNDLVRGARQQAFVREARQQIPPRSLLPPPFGDSELIDIFTKYTSSDINDPPTIVDMLKSFVDVRSAPVRQVSLGELGGTTGVAATPEQVKTAVNLFLGKDLEAPEPTAVEPAEDVPDDKPKDDEPKEDPEPSGPALVDATGTAQQYGQQFDVYLDRRKAKLPVLYPTQIVANSNAAITPESRAHSIEPPDGEKGLYYGYKYVLSYQESFGTSYYGLAGVNWKDPPILNNPSETRRIDGRDYLLFYERDRLRLVGWQTENGSYWVINTLTRSLSEEEMLAVATSAREF